MAEVTNEAVRGQLLALLNEVFEGATASWSYVLDPGPELAFFGTLAKLSADQASREVAGTSVAAQVAHVAFGLGASAGWIRGERVKNDWAQSWSPRTVDEAGWGRLQADLRERYAELRRAIEEGGTASVEAMGGAAGAVAHAAYHLGAVRQKVAWLRATEESRPSPP